MLSVDDTYCTTKCLPGYGYSFGLSWMTLPWDAWAQCGWDVNLGARWFRSQRAACLSCGKPPSISGVTWLPGQCQPPYVPDSQCQGTCVNGGRGALLYCTWEGKWEQLLLQCNCKWVLCAGVGVAALPEPVFFVFSFSKNCDRCHEPVCRIGLPSRVLTGCAELLHTFSL